MKRTLGLWVFTIAFFAASPVAAQYRWEWGRSMYTGAGRDSCSSFAEGWTIATDRFGHVYAGTVAASGTVPVYFDTFRHTPDTSIAFFSPLLKYDTSGRLLWAKFFNCDYFGLTSICTDRYGSVFIAGSFSSDTIRFGAIALIHPHTTCTDCYSNFVAKYDSIGNCLWAKQIDYAGVYPSVATDSIGNVFFFGMFQNAQQVFASDTLRAHQVGREELLLVKIDPSGNYLWARSAGGDTARVNRFLPFGLAVDRMGNAIITGGMSSSIHFDTVTLRTTFDTAVSRVFIAKYSAGGALLWAQSPGGVSHYSTGILGDAGSSLATDSAGNIYVAASMVTASMTFGALTVNNYNERVYDAVLAKFKPNGNITWLKRFGSTGQELAFSIVMDTSDRSLWVSGTLRSPVSYFGADTVYQLDSPGFARSGVDGSFIAQIDSGGNPIRVIPLLVGGDDANALAIDKVGNLYFTGDYAQAATAAPDTVIFGSDTLPRYISQENYFLAKLAGPWVRDTTYDNIGIAKLQLANEVNIYPNPATSQLTITNAAGYKMSVIDVLGREVLKTTLPGAKETIDIAAFAPGIYIVQFVDNKTGTKVVRRIVLQ